MAFSAQGFGSSARESPFKQYYFYFVVFVYLFLGWSYIGVTNPASKQMVLFYMVFGSLAAMSFLIDFIASNKLKFLDTVTIEKPISAFSVLTPKLSLVLAGFLGIVLAIQILRTGTAWISYPTFVLYDSKYMSSFLSGIVGIVEDWIFFGFFFPTLYKNYVQGRNKISAGLIAISITSATFMLFHIFVYSSSTAALFATATFAIISCILVAVTRSLILSNALHFTNNAIASSIAAKIMLFFQG